MTNAEKLIKEHPGLVAHYLAMSCELYGDCDNCPLNETKDCRSEKAVKEWLKSEVEEHD